MITNDHILYQRTVEARIEQALHIIASVSVNRDEHFFVWTLNDVQGECV